MTSVTLLRRGSVAGVVALCLAAGAADASIHSWDYTPGAPGITQLDNSGGVYHDIRSSYDSTNRRLTWSVEFSDRTTQGFALAVTDGVSPLNHRGTAAMIYFDAAAVTTGLSAYPKLTAYAYNGRATLDSWFDADGNPANNTGATQGDIIKSLWDGSWIIESGVTDITLADGALGRRFTMTIDATDLIGHSPLFGDNSTPRMSWRGAGFGSELGLVMYNAQIFDVEYNPDGSIGDLGTEGLGGIGGNNIRTDIPSPGAGALVLAGIGMWLRRRR